MTPALRFVDDYLAHWRRHRPDQPAAGLDGVWWSWAELAERVDRWVGALLAVGVSRGDRVAMVSTPCPEFLAVYLATVRLGAVWVGIDPKHRLPEMRRVVADAAPVVLVAGRGAAEPDEIAGEVPVLRQPGAARRVDVTRDPGDPALLVYTSGSTGQPKGALLTHRGLVTCSRVQAEHWPVGPGERVLCNLPVDHVGCVGDLCTSTVVQGGAISFMEHFDPAGTLAHIERERIALWGQIPVMFQLCLAVDDFDRYDLGSLRRIVFSGATCPTEVAAGLARLGVPLSTSYGSTETTGSVTYTADTDTLADLAGTIGRPDPRFEVRIARPDGSVCADGEDGELQVRGDFVMAGYFRQPAATEAAFADGGWLRTGDVACRRPDGMLVLRGRLSEQFRSGGYTVAPREIEAALESHPAVRLAAVVAVADPVWQQVGHAFVVPDPDAPTAELAADLDAHVRRLLANYKVPKRIEVRTTLPMLAVGKVDKAALRAEAAAGGGDIRGQAVTAGGADD